jgi:hypothetical protein
MLKRILYLGAIVGTVLRATGGLLPIEEKMVGTWQIIGFPSPPAQVARLCFRYYRDHTFETLDCSKEKPIVLSTGTWRIEGNDLVMEEQKVTQPGESAGPIRRDIGRSTIRAASEDRIAFTTGMVLQRVNNP